MAPNSAVLLRWRGHRYLSLREFDKAMADLDRAAEAKAFLAEHTDSLETDVAYARRLKLYRGEITPQQLITPADSEDVQLATLASGLGNWYLVRGDSAQARRWFERSVQSGGWMGFGFIVSEVELRRMK